MVAFDGDVVVVLESERQRWTETVGVDDSLSRELVTTTASVLTDRGRLAHAAPLRARPRGAPEEREKWSNEHQRLFGYRPKSASGACNVASGRRLKSCCRHFVYKLYYANCRQNVTFVYRASALKASAAAQIC